jgi:hypothetical protein
MFRASAAPIAFLMAAVIGSALAEDRLHVVVVWRKGHCLAEAERA